MQESDQKLRNQAIKEIIGTITQEDDKHKILPLLRDPKKPIFPNYDEQYFTVSNAYPSLGIMPHDSKEEKEKIEQQNNQNTKPSIFSVTGNIANLAENRAKPGQPDFNQVFNKL